MKKRILTETKLSRRALLASAAAVSSQAVLLSPVKAKSAKTEVRRKIDIDRFVEDCVAANNGPNPQAAVQDVLARAVSEPGAVLAAIGDPDKAELKVLHRSKALTIFSAAWTPSMNLMPHNHLMWALIGIYTGREDNLLWRKTPEGLEAVGAKALFERDVAALPADVIHSVTNPLERFTGGLHIYGGDFFDTTRSQWDPETLEEGPSDGDAIRKIFARANERMRRINCQ